MAYAAGLDPAFGEVRISLRRTRLFGDYCRRLIIVVAKGKVIRDGDRLCLLNKRKTKSFAVRFRRFPPNYLLVI